MHEENLKKILCPKDRLSQLNFSTKIKNGENHEEVGNIQEQLKTVMEELGQNTSAVSERK